MNSILNSFFVSCCLFSIATFATIQATYDHTDRTWTISGDKRVDYRTQAIVFKKVKNENGPLSVFTQAQTIPRRNVNKTIEEMQQYIHWIGADAKAIFYTDNTLEEGDKKIFAMGVPTTIFTAKADAPEITEPKAWDYYGNWVIKGDEKIDYKKHAVAFTKTKGFRGKYVFSGAEIVDRARVNDIINDIAGQNAKYKAIFYSDDELIKTGDKFIFSNNLLHTKLSTKVIDPAHPLYK